jgi:hypothetical protein
MQKERRAGPRGARQMSSAAKSFWRGLDGAQECRREAGRLSRVSFLESGSPSV